VSNQAITPFKRLGWRSVQHCEFYGLINLTKTTLAGVATAHYLSDIGPFWLVTLAHVGEEALNM